MLSKGELLIRRPQCIKSSAEHSVALLRPGFPNHDERIRNMASNAYDFVHGLVNEVVAVQVENY